MIPVRLPRLSRQMGAPVWALVRAIPDRDIAIPTDGVVACEVDWPTGALLATMPDRDDLVAWDRWVTDLLAAAIRRPELRRSDLAYFGSDRLWLAAACLRAWQWIDDVAWRTEALRHGVVEPEPEWPVITDAGRRTLVALAQGLSRMPHELLGWPLPVLIFDARLLGLLSASDDTLPSTPEEWLARG